jgi:hypothetical protein
MGKDVITVHGEERVVREDTAKSYRGVIWALLSVGAIILITVVLFIGGFLGSFAGDDGGRSPAEIETQRQGR